MAAQPVVSKFVASNGGSLEDGYAETTDWVKTFNACDMPVNLGGSYRTDNPTDLCKWKCSDVEVCVVFGSYLHWAAGLRTDQAIYIPICVSTPVLN